MANTPPTWRFAEAIETCVKRIRVADGYLTDIGQMVVREVAQQDEADLPDTYATVVLSEIMPANQPAVFRTHAEVVASVLVMLRHGHAPDAQYRMHCAIADVQRCLRNAQRDFPPGMRFPRFVSARLLPPVEGMAWAGVEVRFAAHVPLQLPQQ